MPLLFSVSSFLKRRDVTESCYGQMVTLGSRSSSRVPEQWMTKERGMGKVFILMGIHVVRRRNGGGGAANSSKAR